MSTKYQSSRDVPTEVIIARLKELSNAVTGGRQSQEREFTMRIPAECDRDADIVIGEAARRITTLRAQLEQERAKVGKMAKFITLNVENYAGDHACKQCFPYSEILVDGFECGYHMAQRLRNQADEAEKGGSDEGKI